MEENCPASVRGLYAWEIQEARRVFGNQLNYEQARIHECSAWPDWIHHIGLRLQGQKPRSDTHNAITLGNHIYFPVCLLDHLVGPDDPLFYKLGWLIHELTHIWQYQHLGWPYLFKALNVQLKEGTKAYQFGGEDGLHTRNSQGWKLSDFNLEQQGDIARSYYERLVRGEDTRAWSRYITAIQGEDSGTRVA